MLIWQKNEPKVFNWSKFHFFKVTFYKIHILVKLLKLSAKGQLISKCPDEIILSSKMPTKLFLDFCPDFL